MSMTTNVKLSGILFECTWSEDEDDHGSSYVYLETVSVNGVDISEVIDSKWWDKIENEMVKEIVDYNEEMKYESAIGDLM